MNITDNITKPVILLTRFCILSTKPLGDSQLNIQIHSKAKNPPSMLLKYKPGQVESDSHTKGSINNILAIFLNLI